MRIEVDSLTAGSLRKGIEGFEEFERLKTLALVSFSAEGWVAVVYLMTIAGAFCFYLWIWALEHTAPSRVAIAVTANPVAAAILGALILAEPVTWRIFAGLTGVIAGIVLVNWPSRMGQPSPARP